MTATVFIESLKRLYNDKKITSEKLESLLIDKKISRKEYDYIFKK